MKNTIKIPPWLARFVGKGTMSNETVVYDYPMLNLSMVYLQNDYAVGAYRYNQLNYMPAYMKHLVGDIEITPFVDAVEVAGRVRKVRTPATWVLFMTITAESRTYFKNGKKYVRKQFGAFFEKYFSSPEKAEDFEETMTF